MNNNQKNKSEWPIFNFINQKLNQWPLWVKLTSDQKQSNTDTTQTQTPGQPLVLPAKTEVRQLVQPRFNPLFFVHVSRSGFRTVYKYYHCPTDKMTYFFPESGVINQIIQYDQKIFHEIKEPPKDKVYDQVYKARTKSIMPQLKKNAKKKFY